MYCAVKYTVYIFGRVTVDTCLQHLLFKIETHTSFILFHQTHRHHVEPAGQFQEPLQLSVQLETLSLSERRQKVFFFQLEHSQCTITSVESDTQRIFSPLITATGRAYICSRPEYNYLCFISVFARLAHIKKCKVKCPKPFLHSTVALGGHCPGLASSHLRIFASSWHCMGRYFFHFCITYFFE